MLISHLPALANDDVHIRDVLPPIPRARLFHLPHDIHAIKDLPEHDVLAVQERRGNRRDEELRAVAVRAGVLDLVVRKRLEGGGGERGYTYSHGKQPGFGVLQREILIRECLRAVYTRRPRPVSVKEISSLAHEILDLDPTNISHGL